MAAPAHPVILAACALCGADEVYRMGGAQAIAALALGTETIRPVDVIVGPGNLYVQEAKRQVSGRVGIDGFAGPSDLLVLASAGADPRLVALDLLAQAEHGDDSLVVAVSDDARAARRDRARAAGARSATARPSPAARRCSSTPPTSTPRSRSPRRSRPSTCSSSGEAAEALAPRVRRAGCLFVGAASATAFGDYVAGSNHTLPTDGAARFASGPQRRATSAAAWPRSTSAAPPRRSRRAGGAGRRGRGLRRARRVDVGPDPRESADAMSRTAQLSRKTGETDVQVSLDLDGNVAGKMDTGVGFFDHMLDLLARHGRLGLGVTVAGRPRDRRAPHGRGHRHRARAGARPGARRPARDPPLRARRRADGRGARGVRDRRLRPPVLRRRAGSSCRPGTIAGFEHEAAEEFFRAVASAARLTLHIELQAGTNAHHMIEACFKAFARALRIAVVDRPRRDRRAVDQGDADVTVALVDYGMGNRRSVEKALEHVGARVARTADRDEIARGRRDRAARRRRVPGGDAAARRARAGRAAARARGRRRAAARASASACSCCSSRSDGARGRRRARPAARHASTRLRRARAEGPAHRLEHGHVRARRPR